MIDKVLHSFSYSLTLEDSLCYTRLRLDTNTAVGMDHATGYPS